MFSLQLRYFLYGTIISASLISLSVQAWTNDGVFGDYFTRIIGGCPTNTVITGFDSTASASYGTRQCSSLQSILGAIFGSSVAPDWQAMIWFNPDGTPKYGDVNWKKVSSDISYVAGSVGIGTNAPTAKLEVSWTTKTNILQLWNKVLRPGTDWWIRIWDSVGDYNGQGLAAGNLWTNWTLYSAGDVHSDTSLTTPWFSVSYDSWGLKPNFPSGWSMVTQWYGWLNSNPQDSNGSIHVNDIFLRSIGKWMSQIGQWSAINQISLWTCTENHQCDDWQIIDWAWASYWCDGQISSQSTCINVWWNSWGRGCRNACTQIQ